MIDSWTVVRIATALFFTYLWVVVGWEDVRTQKIFNSYVRLAIRGIFVGYVLALAITVGSGASPGGAFYFEAAANLFLCGAAALALWWFGIWPAGDAKLFILLGALYPLTGPATGAADRRLFLAALINTFIPACVVVFVRAGRYVFATRLIHRRRFLIQLGWRKEFDFFLHSLREGAERIRRGAADAVVSAFRSSAADPRAIIDRIALGAANILVLSLVSYYLKDFFRSPILFTLFWAGVFMLWTRLVEVVGVRICRAAVVVMGVALLLMRPPGHWADIWRIILNLTLFTAFFNVGINWTMTVLSGDTSQGYVIAFLVPLIGAGAIGALGSAARRFGVGMPTSMHGILVLAAMGLFFGLSLVLVRLWDRDVESSAIGKIGSYSVLAPGFVERLRQDKEFFAEHFSRLYADGLTADQADALREWCEQNEIKTIPLTPTISFSTWIFLGFFLTRVLSGGHVMTFFAR